MSQLVLIIAKIDEIDNPEKMTELWRQAVPVADLSEMKSEKYLDGMESQVEEIGMTVMRHLFMEQWKLSDKLLAEQFQREKSEPVIDDGFDDLRVASRMGIIHLSRQVCYLPESKKHVIPGNAGLPEHEGHVTTHGLQEWACLLPRNLGFGIKPWIFWKNIGSKPRTLKSWIC